MSWKPSNSQGQGRHTLTKERGFAAIFAASLDISKGGKAGKWPYWHIDLNCGSGWNEKVECLGSPLIFIEEAMKADRAFRALFCDSNEECIRELLLNIKGGLVGADTFWACGGDSAVATSCQDNAKFLVEVGELIASRENPKFAVGTLLCDPNGYPHGFPIDAIRAFAKQFPCIDIILNFNVSLFSRVFNKKRELPGFDDWMPVEYMLETIERPYENWMVSSPPPGGKYERFVTAVGRTLNTGQRKFLHFHPINSQLGQEIIRHFRHIPPDQPLLPGMED